MATFLQFVKDAIHYQLRQAAVKRGLLPEENIESTGDEPGGQEFFDWLKEKAPELPNCFGTHLGKVGFVHDLNGPNEQRFYLHNSGGKVICVVIVGEQKFISAFLMRTAQAYQEYARKNGIMKNEVKIEIVHMRSG